MVASSSADGSIKLWDVRTNHLLQHYAAHQASVFSCVCLSFIQVTSINFHPSGDFLLSTSSDKTIKIWDLREGQQLYTLHGHTGATLTASFSNDGSSFASAGRDETLMLWKTNFDAVIGLRFN